MSRKSLWLFMLVGVAWGLPYLFIRLAVEEFSTPTIIFTRVVIGALVLIPIAIHRKVLTPALKNWRWVLAYALLEMVGPWFLIPEAERVISSGLAGLLVATVPFFGLVIGLFFLRDKSLAHPKTLIGLVVGFSGVILLVGIDAINGHLSLQHVGMVILASAGYAIAPVVANHKMPNVSSVAINGLAMAMVAVIYAVPALFALPSEIAAQPSVEAWGSLLGLGVICSSIAFVAFFSLSREIGVPRASLVTYMNMAVAVILGIILLAEPITTGILIGFPLVLVGSYLATKSTLERIIKTLGTFIIFVSKVLRYLSTILRNWGMNMGGTLATKDTKSLAGLTPKFAVFFDGDEETLYQIRMWIKPFENVGLEWIIITRRPSMANELQKMTKQAKVIVARDRDKLIEVCNLPSLKFIMYVNNARENTEVVRFPHLVHAQLMHGDSEKTASFNPVSGMFTKIFVAGQAGVDRYERNGVKIAADKFEIVGRPQLGGMNVATGPVNPKEPTVLVAPTWGGSALGEELSSLTVTPQLVQALLDAGASVVYRPHPFCARTQEGAHIISEVHELLEQHANKTGRNHVYGPAAETEITVNQAANMSDMIVSDLSGIMSDWLFSLKPYLLVSMDQSAKDFAERYPMGKAGVVVDGREPKDFANAIKELLSADTAKAYEARRKMREYYLAGADNEDRAALFNEVVKRICA